MTPNRFANSRVSPPNPTSEKNLMASWVMCSSRCEAERRFLGVDFWGANLFSLAFHGISTLTSVFWLTEDMIASKAATLASISVCETG